MASPNGPQPGSQQDDQTINNKKKCFRSNYRSLIEALPIDELIPSLYQESIITSELKDKIEAQQTHEERARVFLEEAIQRGLDVGYTKSFDQLIEVMSKSDNVTAQYLAQKLKCCCKCAKCGADISPENGTCVCSVVCKWVPDRTVYPVLIIWGAICLKITVFKLQPQIYKHCY